MVFNTDFDDFYKKALDELKSRPNWSERWIPILQQYVFELQSIENLMKEIGGLPVAVDHTNRAERTNKATSPEWRMFLELTRSASAKASVLKLNPATAPEKSIDSEPNILDNIMRAVK